MFIAIGSMDEIEIKIETWQGSNPWITLNMAGFEMEIYRTPEQLATLIKELNESYDIYTRSVATEQQNTEPESTADATGTSEEVTVSELDYIPEPHR